MTITPIVRQIEVKAPPMRAFELFTRHIGQWWPKGIGKNPLVAVVIEPHVGGQWFERDADGNETHWGKVLAWDPPARLLLGWQIDTTWAFNPGLLTEVEITFSSNGDGGTLVTLEHRNLERFGADAARHVEGLSKGWPARLADFAAYANTNR